MAKKAELSAVQGLLLALVVSSSVSVGLLLARVVSSGSYRFSFMVWNLMLAWLPLLFAVGFRLVRDKKSPPAWQAPLLLIFWLGFLPNSFYMISDLIHLQSLGEASVLYDVTMMASFIINGLILGFMSVYIVHSELQKYLKPRITIAFLSLVFLACGFAIYLGRYLRWNTWDILFNPAGLLFDITERVVNPLIHAQTFVITLVFFAVLGSTYAVIYQIARVLREQ